MVSSYRLTTHCVVLNPLGEEEEEGRKEGLGHKVKYANPRMI